MRSPPASRGASRSSTRRWGRGWGWVKGTAGQGTGGQGRRGQVGRSRAGPGSSGQQDEQDEQAGSTACGSAAISHLQVVARSNLLPTTADVPWFCAHCWLQVLSKGRPDDGWPGLKERQVSNAPGTIASHRCMCCSSALAVGHTLAGAPCRAALQPCVFACREQMS